MKEMESKDDEWIEQFLVLCEPQHQQLPYWVERWWEKVKLEKVELEKRSNFNLLSLKKVELGKVRA